MSQHRAMTWMRTNRHLIMAATWLVLVAPTILWWKDSILWVAFMSLYANFEASLAAHHAKKSGQSDD